ncbi:MAG: hypothetical protein ABI623_02430 [bacterium]
MRCAFPGCPGEYEDKFITHKVDETGGVSYIDNVPAKVCMLCGDTILASETLTMIEKILKGEVQLKE